MKVGVAVADIFTGMYAANAILAALAHRERSGRGPAHRPRAARRAGRHARQPGRGLLVATGEAPRLGNAHPNIVPYQAFRAAATPRPRGRQRRPVRAASARSSGARAGARPALRHQPLARGAPRRARADLAPLMAARATGDWIDALDAAGVPCGPINDLAQVFDDPQVRHRGLRIEVPHRRCGRSRWSPRRSGSRRRRSVTARRRCSASTPRRARRAARDERRRRGGAAQPRGHLMRPDLSRFDRLGASGHR